MKFDFGKLGCGFLRLLHLNPNDISDVDLETTKHMVDLFLERGIRYFDTAYTYLNGKSERCLRNALVERYPGDSYMIATKLPCSILAKGKRPKKCSGSNWKDAFWISLMFTCSMGWMRRTRILRTKR